MRSKRATWSVLAGFIATVTIFQGAVAPAFAGGTHGKQCKPCEALQGCWYPLDPFGGDPPAEPQAECRPLDGEEVDTGACGVPKPPPGMYSLAYCVLEFLGCSPDTSSVVSDDYSTATYTIGESRDFQYWEGSLVIWSQGGEDPAKVGTPYVWSNYPNLAHFLEGSDGSEWWFDPACGEGNRLSPLFGVSFQLPDGAIHDASLWWGYPSAPDACDHPLESVSDGGCTYTFGYASAQADTDVNGDGKVDANDTIDPNDGPTEILLTVNGYPNEGKYAKVSNAYYGTDSPLGCKGSLKHRQVYRWISTGTGVDDGYWELTDEMWQVNGTGAGDCGEPVVVCYADDLARLRAGEGVSDPSTQSVSTFEAYGTQRFTYDSNGRVTAILGGCSSCGGSL